MSRATLYCGDALTVLKTLPDESVQCVITSPPYWGLRDYGVPGQLGLDRTPEEYVEKMVLVFREARRVLCGMGQLWLNLGDAYAGSWGAQSRPNGKPMALLEGGDMLSARQIAAHPRGTQMGSLKRTPGLKSKDLIGLPWRLAFALQTDDWWLRSDIIWSKPNPMPESVTDRPTKSHEYVFLLSKAECYYYDADAISESAAYAAEARFDPGTNGLGGADRKTGKTTRRFKSGNLERDIPAGNDARGIRNDHRGRGIPWEGLRRNARSVWEISTQPYPGAHFAPFPEELARRCILAGSQPGDTILDPFGGSGTVAQVATGNGRNSIYIDLNPKYVELARQRVGPLLCDEATVGVRASAGPEPGREGR